MTAMILPGTYIEVRPEGLIAPGQVTVGNVGVVGTAAKGELNKPILLSSYNDAIANFGPYDSYMDPDTGKPRTDSLTLVRALELAFANGASAVYAMRVAAKADSPDKAVAASATLKSQAGDCVRLTAKSPGDWANPMRVSVTTPGADDALTVEEKKEPLAAATKKVQLGHKLADSARNRVSYRKVDGSIIVPTLVGGTAALKSGEARFDAEATQANPPEINFFDEIEIGAVVTVNYRVHSDLVVKVTIELENDKETYLVQSGQGLVKDLGDEDSGSQLVSGTALPSPVPTPAPNPLPSDQLPLLQSVKFQGGSNGAKGASYNFEPLLDVDAHIIVAAGQTDKQIGAALHAHCQKASTDEFKRDRIAVVGSADGKLSNPPTVGEVSALVDGLIGNTLASDRVVFVAPGFKTNSAAKDDANPITLPGTYTAAVIAGMLASLPPHVSLTNKPVGVAELEVKFNNAQLTELVQNRVTALQVSRGIRVLRGQTTDDGPFREITTRRIVDYAKFGVRSAASPYIGRLNNERVRGALRGTINSFLQGMLDDEMLVAYKLDVTATRDEQIKGIVQVTISLQPVFSINFIRVTMILS